MAEAWVQLACLECEHRWQENPSGLPPTDTTYRCPSCGLERNLAEFLLTHRDLEAVKGLQGES